VGPLPHEKIAYQELDLREAAAEIGADPKPTVGGIPALNKLLLDELILPWRMQKRFGYAGSCQQVMFCSSPDRVHEFNSILYQVAQQVLYPSEDIGIYLLPMERARAIYCSYDLHCNLTDQNESFRVKNLFDKASDVLIGMGAFFDRPYGRWAQMVYSRTGTYTEYLKRIKRELDVNDVMNPGKLCF
jgi:hypothetical protein